MPSTHEAIRAFLREQSDQGHSALLVASAGPLDVAQPHIYLGVRGVSTPLSDDESDSGGSCIAVEDSCYPRQVMEQLGRHGFPSTSAIPFNLVAARGAKAVAGVEEIGIYFPERAREYENRYGGLSSGILRATIDEWLAQSGNVSRVVALVVALTAMTPYGGELESLLEDRLKEAQIESERVRACSKHDDDSHSVVDRSWSDSDALPSTDAAMVDALLPDFILNRAYSNYFWVTEFNRLANKTTADPSNESTMEELGKLSEDFVRVATMFSRVIIAERWLPFHRKSIRPASGVGGIAGGDKYVCNSMFFKFAVDSGGLYGNDLAAGKAARLDLRGLCAIYEHKPAMLNIPLTCLVEHKGTTVLAQALMPIGGEATLVYGSGDGGKVVHADDENANVMMAHLGKKLNLRPHECAGQTMAMCGDIEVHRDVDDSYYVLDCARVMPPEPPFIEQEGKTSINSRVGLLTRQMRPQTVLQSPCPINSDVHTLWTTDRHHDAHKRDLAKLMGTLIGESIPKFASQLNRTQATEVSPLYLTEELHRSGINVRHLRVLYSHLSEGPWRQVVVAEMAARAHKDVIKVLMGTLSARLRSFAVEDPHLTMIRNYLKAVVHPTSSCGAALWKRVTAQYMPHKFPEYTRQDSLAWGLEASMCTLTLDPIRDGCMHWGRFVLRVIQLIGCTFEDGIVGNAFTRELREDLIASAEFHQVRGMVQLEPRVERMAIIDKCMGLQYFLQARKCFGPLRYRLLKQSFRALKVSKATSEHLAGPYLPRVLLALAVCTLDLSEHNRDANVSVDCQSRNTIQKATLYFTSARDALNHVSSRYEADPYDEDRTCRIMSQDQWNEWRILELQYHMFLAGVHYLSGDSIRKVRELCDLDRLAHIGCFPRSPSDPDEGASPFEDFNPGDVVILGRVDEVHTKARLYYYTAQATLASTDDERCIWIRRATSAIERAVTDGFLHAAEFGLFQVFHLLIGNVPRSLDFLSVVGLFAKVEDAVISAKSGGDDQEASHLEKTLANPYGISSVRCILALLSFAAGDRSRLDNVLVSTFGICDGVYTLAPWDTIESRRSIEARWFDLAMIILGMLFAEECSRVATFVWRLERSVDNNKEYPWFIHVAQCARLVLKVHYGECGPEKMSDFLEKKPRSMDEYWWVLLARYSRKEEVGLEARRQVIAKGRKRIVCETSAAGIEMAIEGLLVDLAIYADRTDCPDEAMDVASTAQQLHGVASHIGYHMSAYKLELIAAHAFDLAASYVYLCERRLESQELGTAAQDLADFAMHITTTSSNRLGQSLGATPDGAAESHPDAKRIRGMRFSVNEGAAPPPILSSNGTPYPKGWVVPRPPPGEDERLTAQRVMYIVKDKREGVFDNIARASALVGNTRYSMVNMLGSEEQVFVARHMLPMEKTPRDWGVCNYTIRKKTKTFEVPDLMADERFNDGPACGSAGIRFYAGQSLTGASNQPVGTLCLMHDEPKVLTTDQKAVVSVFAQVTISLFELLALKYEFMKLFLCNEQAAPVVRQARSIIDLTGEGCVQILACASGPPVVVYANHTARRFFKFVDTEIELDIEGVPIAEQMTLHSMMTSGGCPEMELAYQRLLPSVNARKQDHIRIKLLESSSSTDVVVLNALLLVGTASYVTLILKDVSLEVADQTPMSASDIPIVEIPPASGRFRSATYPQCPGG